MRSPARLALCTVALAVLGCSGDATGPGTVALVADIPINVSGGENSERYFTIEVPDGAELLRVTLSGGSGDADLVLRFGSRPTETLYDCVSSSFTNEENCEIPTPSAGTWHVLVYGFEAYSDVTLLASLPPVTQLTSGVAATALAGIEGGTQLFRITVPAGTANLTAVTTGGTGDLDLYVTYNTPSLALAECTSGTGTNEESCELVSPVAGTWYIILYGFSAYANASLTVTLTAGATVEAAPSPPSARAPEPSSFADDGTSPPSLRPVRARFLKPARAGSAH